MTKQQRRGFTLTEVMTTVGVIAILSGTAVSGWRTLAKRQKESQAGRLVTAKLKLIRARGVAGTMIAGGPGIRLDAEDSIPTAVARTTYLQTGVQAVNDHTLVFFGRPGANDTEMDVLEIVDFDQTYPNMDLQVAVTRNGAPSEVRFERSGVRDLASADTITITGPDRQLTIRVSGAGTARLTETAFR